MRNTFIISLVISIFLLSNIESVCQGVSINNWGAGADTSAILDISDTTKGLLIPRLALTGTSSASPIIQPATSLLIYNTATVSDVTPGYYYWNGSSWDRIATGSGGSGSAGGFTNFDIIDAVGSSIYIVPAGITKIMVEIWGGGGGGALNGAGGPGGGGGGYGKGIFDVSPGQNCNYTIGGGGAAATGTNNGTAGENSSFTDGTATITAYGGSGGIYANAGGTGGTATGTSITIISVTGGPGGNYASISLCGYGGHGACGGAGGSGGIGSLNANKTGTIPGGGGAGGSSGAGSPAGNGAQGRIIVWY